MHNRVIRKHFFYYPRAACNNHLSTYSTSLNEHILVALSSSMSTYLHFHYIYSEATHPSSDTAHTDSPVSTPNGAALSHEHTVDTKYSHPSYSSLTYTCWDFVNPPFFQYRTWSQPHLPSHNLHNNICIKLFMHILISGLS